MRERYQELTRRLHTLLCLFKPIVHFLHIGQQYETELYVNSTIQ